MPAQHKLISPLTRRLLAAKGVPGPTAVPPPAAHTEETRPIKRHKLWELEDKYHCPIVGTCLPLAELVKFARRFQLAADPHDEFALHVEAVCHTRERNPFSAALQRHFDAKYRQQLERFAQYKNDADVLAGWRAAYARGEVASALWAACTHKAASEATRQRIYADIHMLSHQVGAGQAADCRRLAHLEAENAALKLRLQEEAEAWRQRLTEARHEVAQQAGLRAELEQARAELKTTQAQLARYANGTVLVDMGERLAQLQRSNEQLMATASQAWKLDKLLRVSHEECQRIADERNAALDEKQHLEDLLQMLEQPADAGCNEAGGCDFCEQPLNARCILYVGGRHAMIAQYRQLAERLGVRLVHHDGGIEESVARLPDLIRSADIVLCPTDKVSHNAYYQVKQQCKRVGKPCLFYEGSSVKSFALALGRISRGEYSLS